MYHICLFVLLQKLQSLMLDYSSSTERAQQAALMVRPRRLSDSSVSSACSENETNYVNNIPGISANALPHVRSQNVSIDFCINTKNYLKKINFKGSSRIT